MSNIERIISEALTLSTADRLDVIEQIWDSIASEQDALDLTATQRQELDRRIADMDAHPESGIPWDQVKKSCTDR